MASLEFLSGDGRDFFAGGSLSLLSFGALSCEEATCTCCWRARRAATALTAERGAAVNRQQRAHKLAINKYLPELCCFSAFLFIALVLFISCDKKKLIAGFLLISGGAATGPCVCG